MAEGRQCHGVAAELRRLATYSAGVAEGLAQAATVVERCNEADGESEDRANDPSNRSMPSDTRQQVSRNRVPTMRPVLDVLRRAEGKLSPSEIITQCRRDGYDVRRESVQDALKRAVDKGVVEAVGGGRYRAVRD